MSVFKAETGVTPVSNVFIEKYMPESGSYAFAAIYIYALKYAISGTPLENADIAQRFGLLESDVIKAWKYWAEMGIVDMRTVGSDCEITFLPPDDTAEPVHKSCKGAVFPADTEEILKKNPDVRQLVEAAERIYGRLFSPADLNAVVRFSTQLKLPGEVVLLLFNHCKGRPMSYIELTAQEWADRDIRTSDAVEKHIGTYKEVLSFFGVSHGRAAEYQLKFIGKWIYDMNMPPELIQKACGISKARFGSDTAVRRLKELFSYTNGILENWHRDGVRTLHQLERAEGKPVEAPAFVRPQIKPTKFVNYDQPVYSAEDDREVIRRKNKRKINEQTGNLQTDPKGI